MDKIKDLLDKMERFTDQFSKIYEGQVIKEYVSSLRPLVEDLHSRLKLWEGRADQLRKDCDRLYADRNNWMKQALAEDERANATQLVTNCNGFKGRLALEQIRAALLLDSGCGPASALHLAVDKFTQEALAEPPQRKGSVDMSEHDEIITEAREKYTVHNCDQCEFRKSCANEFDSDECKRIRQSIMLGFGIEDGCFTKLLDRLEAAHKREIEDAIAATVKAAAKSVSEVYEPHIQSEPVSNAAKMREALERIDRIVWDKHRHTKEEIEAHRLATEALTAPPRNCDLYSYEEALQIWSAKVEADVIYGFDFWLYEKGGDK